MENRSLLQPDKELSFAKDAQIYIYISNVDF